MKPKDYSEAESQKHQSIGNKKLIGRREVINKAGLYALSAATMMVLMKSQAKASTSLPAPPVDPPQANKEWRRTTRT